jgi:hypothetical protein
MANICCFGWVATIVGQRGKNANSKVNQTSEGLYPLNRLNSKNKNQK